MTERIALTALRSASEDNGLFDLSAGLFMVLACISLQARYGKVCVMYPINFELSDSHIIDFAFVRSFVPFYKNTGTLRKYKVLLLSGGFACGFADRVCMCSTCHSAVCVGVVHISHGDT